MGVFWNDIRMKGLSPPVHSSPVLAKCLLLGQGLELGLKYTLCLATDMC